MELIYIAIVVAFSVFGWKGFDRQLPYWERQDRTYFTVGLFILSAALLIALLFLIGVMAGWPSVSGTVQTGSAPAFVAFVTLMAVQTIGGTIGWLRVWFRPSA